MSHMLTLNNLFSLAYVKLDALTTFFRSQIMKLMNSILGEKLFNMLMKATFYGHFVAGEDQVKIVPTLER